MGENTVFEASLETRSEAFSHYATAVSRSSAERHLPCSVLYVSLQWCHMELSQENIWPLNVLFIKIICPRESKLAKSDEINERKSRNTDRAKTGIFRTRSDLKRCLSLLRL